MVDLVVVGFDEVVKCWGFRCGWILDIVVTLQVLFWVTQIISTLVIILGSCWQWYNPWNFWLVCLDHFFIFLIRYIVSMLVAIDNISTSYWVLWFFGWQVIYMVLLVAYFVEFGLSILQHVGRNHWMTRKVVLIYVIENGLDIGTVWILLMGRRFCIISSVT